MRRAKASTLTLTLTLTQEMRRAKAAAAKHAALSVASPASPEPAHQGVTSPSSTLKRMKQRKAAEGFIQPPVEESSGSRKRQELALTLTLTLILTLIGRQELASLERALPGLMVVLEVGDLEPIEEALQVPFLLP